MKRYRETQPHEGFRILKEIAEKRVHGAFIFTSNVDGQFQKAGFDDSRIAECHGSIHHLQCTIPCSASIWTSEGLSVEIDEENCCLLSNFPLCPECHGLARPNILMFNDWGWISNRTEMQMERLNKWYRQTSRLVVIEIGAGVHVPQSGVPANHLTFPSSESIRITLKSPNQRISDWRLVRLMPSDPSKTGLNSSHEPTFNGKPLK